ncbi:MAG: hypothetical protein GYB49_04900 [Alphaproteobacteria bacterium]|nr:hypothetical protein [Alphaproteobacteria bacterium]
MRDAIDKIFAATTAPEIYVATNAALADLGLTRTYYLGLISNDRTRGRNLLSFGFSSEWEISYREGFRSVDPIPGATALQPGPLFWHHLPPGLSLRPEEQAYLDKLQDWDMSQGICTLVFGPHSRVAMIGASMSPGDDSIDSVDVNGFHVIAMASFAAYYRKVGMKSEKMLSFSTRELDVLYWMAQGLSNIGIAKELNLSPEAVASCTKQLMSKMNVFDRTAAVMRGVQLGYVIVSDDVSRRVDSSTGLDVAEPGR